MTRPTKTSDFKIVASSTSVKKNWDECVRAANNNMAQAWDVLTAAPTAVSHRQMQLRGRMSHRRYKGTLLEQWHSECTRGAEG